MSISERLSAMTGRGGSKGRTSASEQTASGKPESKEEKEQKRADNAQNASDNTANQASGNNGQSDQEMIEMFMLQAGMNRRDDAKKRRAMLTGDA